MPIPTEPIGSIPRPENLRRIAADGGLDQAGYDDLVDDAVADTIKRLEAVGSPVVTDGEQGKPSFVSYPLHGIETLAPDGPVIPFADGHTRQLPRLTAGPFRYGATADSYLVTARSTQPVR